MPENTTSRPGRAVTPLGWAGSRGTFWGNRIGTCGYAHGHGHSKQKSTSVAKVQAKKAELRRGRPAR